jgi:hypothetical protein
VTAPGAPDFATARAALNSIGGDVPALVALRGFVDVAEAALAEARADRDRLDWMEQQEGAGLISDDGGRWAVSETGMQNLPEEEPIDISTSFFIQKDEWKPSVREAIDAARLAQGDSP